MLQIPEFAEQSQSIIKDPTLGSFWWKLLHSLGGGSYMKGRRALFDVDMVDVLVKYGLGAIDYAQKENPEGFLTGCPPEVAIQTVTHILLSGQGSSLAAHFTAYHFDQGLSVVQLGHKLAASFMLTNSDAALDDIRLPFNSFVIDVPGGLLKASTEEGPGEIRKIIVGNHVLDPEQDGVGYIVMGTGKVTIWGLQGDLPTLLRTRHWKLEFAGALDHDIVEDDERNIILIQRLIAGVCLYMTNGGAFKAPKVPTKKKASKRKGRSGAPRHRIYRLTQDVEHNFSEAVTAYSTGDKKRLQSVQSVVAGHWKSQPYGPGRTQRKRIFVEPYWWGPEDSPIAKRSHSL